MKLFVIGSSSFAAQGLTKLLLGNGHEVWSFNRRPETLLGARGLAGNISAIGEAATRIGFCDVVINYLLLKDESLDCNLHYLKELNKLLKATHCQRFIHISSISVLPPVNGTVTEQDEPSKNFHQKGAYARLKIATELWVTANMTHCEIVLVRPGFVLGPGLLDPIIGMGKLLPTQRIMGMGHRKSIIPIISRSILNEGITRLCALKLADRRTTVMFTDPDSPERQHYLEYCCERFGIGRSTVFLARWVWRTSLAAASLPLSLMKRRWNNLPDKFSHNLKVRRYDSRSTERLLNLDLRGDWKRLLGEALEFQNLNFRLPALLVDSAMNFNGTEPGVCYMGMGRIAVSRHLPALAAFRHLGCVEWYDPFVKAGLKTPFKLRQVGSPEEFRATKAVITTPVGPRIGLLSQLPSAINEVLFEKPFAISESQFSELSTALDGKAGYVIHNYRFKPNVQWAWRYLAKHNPGELLETRLHFDSPAVDLDKAAWMRDERQARTLLLDYAIHFLDLAWLLAEGPAEIKHLQVRQNLKGQTAAVSATVKFANHISHILLRQGARQRRCQLDFAFSNYTLVLRFFPDTAVVIHGQHSFADDFRLSAQGLVAMGRKISEKLGLTNLEPSHQYLLGSFLGYYRRENIEDLSLHSLRPFYSRLFALAEPVYNARPDSATIGHTLRISNVEPDCVLNGR